MDKTYGLIAIWMVSVFGALCFVAKLLEEIRDELKKINSKKDLFN